MNLSEKEECNYYSKKRRDDFYSSCRSPSNTFKNLKSGTKGAGELYMYASLFIQETGVSNQFLIYITEMVWDYNQTFQNRFCIFGTIV